MVFVFNVTWDTILISKKYVKFYLITAQMPIQMDNVLNAKVNW